MAKFSYSENYSNLIKRQIRCVFNDLRPHLLWRRDTAFASIGRHFFIV